MERRSDGTYEKNRGWNLLNDIDCTKNESAAIRWFKKSVKKGCTTAMVNLGNIYEGRQDYKNAYYWYQELRWQRMKPVCLTWRICTTGVGMSEGITRRVRLLEMRSQREISKT